MAKFNQKKSQLLQLFEIEKCLTISTLSDLLNYSDRSVQRLLKDVGYYSSYTHNAKWYTLKSIPIFNKNGLWFYQNIGFSKVRNLTSTILYLLDISPQGLTANNLSEMLLTSCPPILNRLYKAKKINRVKTPKGYIYFSNDPAIQKKQLNNFDNLEALPSLLDAEKITILIEFIRNPNQSIEDLAMHLKKNEQVYCTAAAIMNFFIFNGLEKKIQKKPKMFSLLS